MMVTQIKKNTTASPYNQPMYAIMYSKDDIAMKNPICVPYTGSGIPKPLDDYDRMPETMPNPTSLPPVPMNFPK